MKLNDYVESCLEQCRHCDRFIVMNSGFAEGESALFCSCIQRNGKASFMGYAFVKTIGDGEKSLFRMDETLVDFFLDEEKCSQCKYCAERYVSILNVDRCVENRE